MLKSPKLSIIIPARNELYLIQTVNDLFQKSIGEIEVIVILDGCNRDPGLVDRPGLIIIPWTERKGMRAAINSASEIATGKYLMKVDAHCMFGEGFDEILCNNCNKDWVVTPRRYSLVAESWTVGEKKYVDYEYLCWPGDPENGGLHAKYWWHERQAARENIKIDENMSFQGSCWLMHTDYFRSLIYPMQEEGYGTFIGEAVEIGLKIWLSGGKCMVNKNAWYAHLWKGQGYRDLHLKRMGFSYTRIGHSEWKNGNIFCSDYWINDRWEKRIHNLEWLIDRFSPVPGWPEDRKQWTISNIS